MPASASALYFAGCGRRAVEYGGEQAGAAQEVGHSARSPFRKTGHRISAKHRGGTLRGVKPCGLRCQCGERNAWSLGLRGLCFFYASQYGLRVFGLAVGKALCAVA